MRVFVSYDSHDEELAQELRENLDRLGIKVWNPSVELLPGSNWLLETGKALERADAVVFLLSPHALKSRWSRMEMQYVLGRPNLEDRVIPIVLGRLADVPWIMRPISIPIRKRDASKIAQTIADRLKRPLRARARPTRRRTKANVGSRQPMVRSAKASR